MFPGAQIHRLRLQVETFSISQWQKFFPFPYNKTINPINNLFLFHSLPVSPLDESDFRARFNSCETPHWAAPFLLFFAHFRLSMAAFNHW